MKFKFGPVSFFSSLFLVAAALGPLGIIAFSALMVYGYFHNIWILASMLMGHDLTFISAHMGEVIIRVIGIFYGPIGVIAGYF